VGDPPPESTRESERETVRMDAMANPSRPAAPRGQAHPPPLAWRTWFRRTVPYSDGRIENTGPTWRGDAHAKTDPFANDETRTNERFLEACDGWRTGAASLEAQDPTRHPRTCRARRFMDQAPASRHPSSFRTS